jgi:hypothetical protein
VVCDQCREPLEPWDVRMEDVAQEVTGGDQ